MDKIKCIETKLERLILIALIMFIFFTMYYYDNQTVFLQIQNNMDRIVGGEWYYLLNGWVSALPYGVLLQCICAVWSLPVFVLSKLGVLSRTAVIARLWYKAFVLIFLALDTWQIGRLSDKLKIQAENKKWVKLFFLSSLITLLPAVHVAQLDAVYLFFVLLGIGYYISDNYWLFLICFMIAIPGKYIPLFIFIPLVLLKEKRYLYIIRDLFVGCVLVLVDRGLNSIGYRLEVAMGIDPSLIKTSNPVTTNNFESLLSSDFKAFGTQMSIVVLCFAILCIWCYSKDSSDKNKFAIFASFTGIALLFAFGVSTPYWIVLLVPFMILLIFKKDVSYGILIPLEMIFSVGYVYVYMISSPWIFGSYDTFDFLVFSFIPGFNDSIHGMIYDFINVRGLATYDGVMSAIMVACLLGIMFISYPLKGKVGDKQDENTNLIKCWYWVRILLIIGWIVLNIWVVALNHVW